MKKLLANIVVALLAITVLVLTGNAQAKSLKLAHSTWAGYGPFYIAQEKGFFKEEGIEVEIFIMEDVRSRLLALSAGEIDVAAGSVDSVVNNFTEWRKYRYLFGTDDSNSADGIVSNLDINSIADLKGKKIGVADQSVSQFFLSVLLNSVGLSLRDIEEINLTAGEAGKAFIDKQLDAAVTWEPWLTRGKATDHGKVLVDSSATPGLITGVLYALPEKAEKKRTELQALYRAWVKAVRWQKANPDEANIIMAKGIGSWLSDPAVFKETLLGIELLDDTGNQKFMGTREEPGLIVSTIDYAIKLGGQKPTIAPGTAMIDLIDYSIMESN